MAHLMLYLWDMQTAKLNGRYTVGAVLFFRGWIRERAIARGERRYMTPEQAGALTQVRAVSVETREMDAHDAIEVES